MHRQTQGSHQGSFKAGAATGGTDWQALELQLNRTRTILQEILVHLQEVLRNLKMARTGGRGFAAGSGSETHTRHEFRFRAQTGTTGQQHFRSQNTGTNASGSRGTTTTTSGFYRTAGGNGHTASAGSATAGASGSERFRSWTRPGANETRAETGQSKNFRNAGNTETTGTGRTFRATAGAETGGERARFRSSTTAGEKNRTTENRWSARAGASSSQGQQSTAGESFRERSRFEGASRTTTGAGSAGARTEARFGAGKTSSTSSGTQREQTSRSTTASRSAKDGFRMDQTRQDRARQAARQSGMNLKCAYDILCLDYPCSVDEIKVAYRFMARLYHPDLGGDEEAMKDVNVAYELAMRFSAGPRRASTAWAV